jgi:hypothetical protein
LPSVTAASRPCRPRWPSYVRTTQQVGDRYPVAQGGAECAQWAQVVAAPHSRWLLFVPIVGHERIEQPTPSCGPPTRSAGPCWPAVSEHRRTWRRHGPHGQTSSRTPSPRCPPCGSYLRTERRWSCGCRRPTMRWVQVVMVAYLTPCTVEAGGRRAQPEPVLVKLHSAPQ